MEKDSLAHARAMVERCEARRAQQTDLATIPPQKRAEAIALARQRALEKPGSYLSKYFERLYGVK